MKPLGATAPEIVKTLAPRDLRLLDLSVLRQFFDDKEFPVGIPLYLAQNGLFGALFSQLVLRTERADIELLDQYALSLPFIDQVRTATYTGSHEQNGRIDSGLSNSGIATSEHHFGEGAATFFATRAVNIPRVLANTPIAIIGYGAAGILVAYALRELGFGNIDVYEKSNRLGIWSMENVFRLSRNNPRRITFYDRVLEPAPGNGDEVRKFLELLAKEDSTKLTVARVLPGRLNHTLRFSDGSEKRYPIVINAMGLGKPRPLSDKTRMTTTAERREAGVRWQQRLSRTDVKDKRFVFVGLGNSTAEMLRQIHLFMDQGMAIDYRVLTHYPEDSVHNPNVDVYVRDKKFRLFRDMSRPNLVDFQGDLPLSRHDYHRALRFGKIISGVRSWEVDGGVLVALASRKKVIEQFPYDTIMTLTGYEHSEETFTAMGCAYDTEGRCALFDYDGEFLLSKQNKGTGRLAKGYFGFGSVTETPQNRNAIVIPGMIHRIGDLLFGVVMRAVEARGDLH